MKHALFIVFLLPVQRLSAQPNSQPGNFDRFITKPGIAWAAYASDTFNFRQAGFNNLLLQRLQRNEIKVTLPVESRTREINTVERVSKAAIDSAFYGPREDSVMDESGNILIVKRPIPEIDTANFTTTEVTQILYIKNGSLKSYIPFVTPTLPVYTSTGMYIGQRLYFNTGYRYVYNHQPRNKKKLLFLTRTKKVIRFDTLQQENALKNLYGKNLLTTLWPDIMDNKIPAFTPDKKQRLKPEEINQYKNNYDHVLVPVYNDEGAVVKYEVLAQTVDFTAIPFGQLEQDWYYDRKKNRLYAFIREMTLYIKQNGREPAPFVTLDFDQ